MDARELKKITDIKLNDIADTIASFFDEKYREEIIKKINNTDYYFYDSYSENDRLVNVELKRVAKEFANDITLDLDANSDRKAIINEALANAIIYYEAKEDIISVLDQFEETKDNQELKDKLVEVVGWFRDDHEARKIIANRKKSFEEELEEYNSAFIKENFNYKTEGSNSTYAMENYIKYYENGDESRLGTLLDFMGAKSILEARVHGLITSPKKANPILEKYHEGLDELAINYAYDGSNLKDIVEDITKSGATINVTAICKYVAHINSYRAINFSMIRENEYNTFIVYFNDDYVYSSRFNETFIHELLHHIGTHNAEKNGLDYYRNYSTMDVEEGYVTYLAKKIAKDYTENHGPIISSDTDKYYSTEYDSCMDYMDEVFRLYGDQLMKIHLEDITYKDAIKLCPLLGIDKSIKAIKKSKGSEHVLNNEISKLRKMNKR